MQTPGCNYTCLQDAAVDLTVRYPTDKRLSDKAFDMIDSAAALQRRLGNKNVIPLTSSTLWKKLGSR